MHGRSDQFSETTGSGLQGLFDDHQIQRYHRLDEEVMSPVVAIGRTKGTAECAKM